MESLQNMDDTTILNALFDIAAIEAEGELTLQDEQDYQELDWEMSKRGECGISN